MTAGQRILFAIPWGERIILGTTDTDYYGPIEAVTADASDVAYILNIVNRHFPDRRIDLGRRDSHLGRRAPADRHRARRPFGHLPCPSDSHAGAGLVRRGRRQADDLSPHRPAGGRSRRRAPGPRSWTVPHCRRAFAAARSRSGFKRHSPAAGSCRTGRALLPPRMCHASGRRDGPPDELALLSPSDAAADCVARLPAGWPPFTVGTPRGRQKKRRVIVARFCRKRLMSK